MGRPTRVFLAGLLFLALATPAVAQPFSVTGAVKRDSGSASLSLGGLKPMVLGLDDDIPGVPLPASPVVGTLDADLDMDDVFAVNLVAGQRIEVSLTGDTGTDFDVYLFGPNATSVVDFENMVAGAEDPYAYPEVFSFDVPTTGTYYVDLWAAPEADLTLGGYTFTYTIGESGKTPTDLTLTGPATCEFGSAKISGYLKDIDGNPIADAPIFILYQNSSTGWEWDIVNDLLFTDSTGKYSRTMAPKANTTYQTYFVGDEDTYIEQFSASVDVLPKARLTRTTSWSTLYRDKAYYAKGYIEPYHKESNSNKVKIRAYKKGSDGDYHYIKSFTASYNYYSKSKTAYKAKVVLTSKGTWMLKAYHATDTTNYKTYGSPDYVTVK